ncbi:MAG: peroxiredoxin family protein [Bryobacteraceae bacterium]
MNLRRALPGSLGLLTFLLPVLGGTPRIGEKPPDFALSTPEGKIVQLSEVVAKGPVALVVLRGYPGYQCPYCNRQVQDFLRNADDLAKAGLHVLMVYPGPPQELGAKASEFLADKHLPGKFDLVLDPGYQFTNAYGLRWDAPNETAYPSTFLIDPQQVIFFSKIARMHGGRTTGAEILDAMQKSRARS